MLHTSELQIASYSNYGIDMEAFLGRPLLRQTSPATLSAISSSTTVSHTSRHFWNMRIQLSRAPYFVAEWQRVSDYVRQNAPVSRGIYMDKQYGPQELYTESDAADMTVSNLLFPVLEALNDLLSHKSSGWRVQLKAQLVGNAQQGRLDHMIVAVRRGISYNPDFAQNWCQVEDYTRMRLQGEQLPTQFALVIIEEKRPSYLITSTINAYGARPDDSLDLATQEPSSLLRAAFAQLLKYNEMFKCRRLVLFDYLNCYMLQVNGIALKQAAMVRAREQAKQARKTAREEFWRNDGTWSRAQKKELEEHQERQFYPDITGNHKSVLTDVVRGHLFAFAFSALQQLECFA